MRRAVTALLLVVALSCRPAHVPDPTIGPSQPSRALQELAQANDLARGKNPRKARDLYLKIARDYPTDPDADEALTRSASGIGARAPRDYGAAPSPSPAS